MVIRFRSLSISFLECEENGKGSIAELQRHREEKALDQNQYW
jgi:hypothetical protein